MSMIYQPETVEEALKLLAREETMACAGATNLYVDRRHGKYLDRDYVSLDRLEDLKEIRKEQDGWHLGGMVNFSRLEQWDVPFAAALSQAAAMVGGPQIRNRGTIGGNIISASPAADSVPPLMALDALLLLERAGGEAHLVPIVEFMKGVGRVDLLPDELLTEIIVPEKGGRSLFYKAGKRNALAVSVCSQAVYMNCREGRIAEIAVSLGSVAPTAVRAARVENLLLGTRRASLEGDVYRKELRSALMEDIAPIDDIRATAEYRRRIAYRMLLHNLKELWRGWDDDED